MTNQRPLPLTLSLALLSLSICNTGLLFHLLSKNQRDPAMATQITAHTPNVTSRVDSTFDQASSTPSAAQVRQIIREELAIYAQNSIALSDPSTAMSNPSTALSDPNKARSDNNCATTAEAKPSKPAPAELTEHQIKIRDQAENDIDNAVSIGRLSAKNFDKILSSASQLPKEERTELLKSLAREVNQQNLKLVK